MLSVESLLTPGLSVEPDLAWTPKQKVYPTLLLQMQPLEGRQQSPSQVVTENLQQDMLDAQLEPGSQFTDAITPLVMGAQ